MTDTDHPDTDTEPPATTDQPEPETASETDADDEEFDYGSPPPGPAFDRYVEIDDTTYRIHPLSAEQLAEAAAAAARRDIPLDGFGPFLLAWLDDDAYEVIDDGA